jgi:hypothetical protein
MVSTYFLLLPRKESLITRQHKKGAEPPPPAPEVNQFTEPRDTRSGAYVTAQIVTICRTSGLLYIDFSIAGKLHEVYFSTLQMRY